MSSHETALDLQGILMDALADDPAIDECDVVLDPVRALSSLNAGTPVVVVQPPRLEFLTHAATEAVWEIVAAAPTRDAVEAWPDLDQLLAVLATALDATEARFGGFQGPTGDPWPAVIVETTTTLTRD